MNKKAARKVPTLIDPTEVKIRKRYAPGVRIIKSEKDKKGKHKKDLRLEVENECE